MLTHRVARVVIAFALAVATLTPVSAAGAVPTVVDFEDLSFARTGRSFTALSSHGGVTFPDGVTAIDYSRPGYQVAGFATHSGTVGIEECFGEEFSCPDPIDMAFRSAMFRVKVWVGSTRTLVRPGRTVVLEVFDALDPASRRLVGRSTAVLLSPRNTGPVSVNTPLEVVLPTNSIRSARVRFIDSNNNTLDSYGLVADDIEFEQGVPAFAVTPNPVDYAQVALGQAATRTVTVRNTGQVQGSIKQAVVTGGNASDFTIAADSCSGRTVNPGASCTVDVRYRPGALGTRSSTLVVSSDAPSAPNSVRLIGQGVTTTTAATATTTPAGPGPGRPGTTTVSIPPTTPGSTLAIDRPLGRAGDVVIALGTGFQPGAVSLIWAPGIGVTQANAAADGTFEVTIVLIAGDAILGPRTLIATGPASVATAPFLLVPGSMRPSGGAASIVHRR